MTNENPIENAPGQLIIIATPIGNLGDLSERAKTQLNECDMIACEDTRVTSKILAHLNLNKPCFPYHEHNETKLSANLADQIVSGKRIALVTDAGTPGISDPGFRLVRECRKRNLPVIPVPGPNAAVTALMASGLPTDSFLFLGFLPPKTAARKRILEAYRDASFTIIIYESCHRVVKALNDTLEVLGPERIICVAKEITKLHEKFFTGSASEVLKKVEMTSKKGEFVILIAKQSYEL